MASEVGEVLHRQNPRKVLPSRLKNNIQQSNIKNFILTVVIIEALSIRSDGVALVPWSIRSCCSKPVSSLFIAGLLVLLTLVLAQALVVDVVTRTVLALVLGVGLLPIVGDPTIFGSGGISVSLLASVSAILGIALASVL